jgi:hypothetical protein
MTPTPIRVECGGPEVEQVRPARLDSLPELWWRAASLVGFLARMGPRGAARQLAIS